MTHVRKTMIFLLAGAFLFSGGAVFAVPPDFNADRRVNVKCPSTIDYGWEGQFEVDGFMQTIRRLYHELEKNLWAAERRAVEGQYGDGYAFSDDPNKGIFFIIHAKAFFPSGSLGSLYPLEKIDFQEIFYVSEIDWDKQQLSIIRQRDKKKYSISVGDFEKAFLWYNALLDKHRAFIPLYGFLSLPGEADEFPTIWNSWEAHKRDTATPPESLIDYDFYKVLDYKDGYYLLAQDYNEFDYRDNIEDFGIIGWVEKKYITLWRSRLYYHPQQNVQFFDDKAGSRTSPLAGEINKFYVDHVYLKERLFRDIVEKLDQESLHKFYTHFGFPQLAHPEHSAGAYYTKVFIPGAFTPRLMRLLGNSIKRNLNTFFLLDVSESMRPFADYVVSFNKSVQSMREAGIGLRVNRIFGYSDSPDSDRDMVAVPNFVRVKRPKSLTFIEKSADLNYAEPLMRALNKILDEIESLQKEGLILPLHEKLLFVITDAGANDLTDEALERAVKKAQDLNLSVYFIYPSNHGVRVAGRGMDDTPDDSYNQLKDIIARFEASNAEGTHMVFRKFEFEAHKLKSKEERRKDFTKQHKRLLDGIKTYVDHVFKAEGVGDLPKDVILYFSDEKLLTEMRKWSDRKIQVLNHVVKYIKDVENASFWDERIAIPAKPVEAYLRAIRMQDDVTLSDLKKLIIINSLVSVDDVERSRKLYDHIKPLIEKRTFQSADAVFYKALTSKEPGQDIEWNRALGEDQGPLPDYLSKRGFHLNSFNQAVQRKFMYIKVGELYSP
ncbi:MAG: VWA domain-containing protein [Deltaproteobacteria bacterium]|nr:VWA domain-containing protein [Deltaproteobacteria bacterium]